MRRATTGIAILTGAATVSIFSLIAWHPTLRSALGEEAYKQILQFALITVIGGTVSALYAEFKREQDNLAQHRAYLLTFYNSALVQYNKSKKIRRMLRNLLSESPIKESETGSGYVNLILQLQDVQLEFEAFRRQVTVQGNVFPQHILMRDQLQIIQIYLRSIVREYEHGRHHITPLSSESLPRLREYVSEQEEGGNYVKMVAIPFEEIEVILLRALESRL